VNSEYNVVKYERESKVRGFKKTIDVVYTDRVGHRRFCFELKNIRIQDLKNWKTYENNYDKLKEVSDMIAKQNIDMVLSLELKPQNECPVWFQQVWAPTVGGFVEKIVAEVKNKYQVDLQKDDKQSGKALAWVIVRVGLGKLIYTRVF
jgi:hypothetical protein